MTAVFVSIHDDNQEVYYGVEAYLVNYVKIHGRIICLDQWAHDMGITSWYARLCAHRAEEKGLLRLVQLKSKAGKPYQVEYIGKEEKA